MKRFTETWYIRFGYNFIDLIALFFSLRHILLNATQYRAHETFLLYSLVHAKLIYQTMKESLGLASERILDEKTYANLPLSFASCSLSLRQRFWLLRRGFWFNAQAAGTHAPEMKQNDVCRNEKWDRCSWYKMTQSTMTGVWGMFLARG